MVVDIAPQTELATYTGLYYFASTSVAVLGPFIFAIAFVFMLFVRHGERAETAVQLDG